MSAPRLVITPPAPTLPREGAAVRLKETGCYLDEQLFVYYNPLNGVWLYGAEGIHCATVSIARADGGSLQITGLLDLEEAPATVFLTTAEPLHLEAGRLSTTQELIAVLDQSRSHSVWVANFAERYDALLIASVPAAAAE